MTVENSNESGAREPQAPGYALFLHLEGRSVVVIGGGPVAERKVETVLPFHPRIKVVAPEVTPGLQELSDNGEIELVKRPYRRGDLAGARLVFSACGNPAVDDEVCVEAEEERALINVVDVPEKCEFIVPSTVIRGPLRIAVSTSGCSPVEARTIRRDLEKRYDESWEPYLNLMREVRALVKERVPGPDSLRKPIFESCAQAGWRERIAAGEQLSAEDAYAEAMGKQES